MDLFKRPKPGSIKPEVVTPPAELATEARIGEVDDKLRAIVAVPRGERSEGLLWQENKLLDARNKIRPGRSAAVPVIPGRTS